MYSPPTHYAGYALLLFHQSKCPPLLNFMLLSKSIENIDESERA